MAKLVKNAIKCRICNTIAESKHRHDFASCACGACAADGGLDYMRRSFEYMPDTNEMCYEECSEWED